MPTHDRPALLRRTTPTLAAAALLLAGCAGSEKTERTAVRAGDFQAAPTPRPAPDPAIADATAAPSETPSLQPVPGAAKRPISQVPVMAVSSTPEGVMDVTSYVGAPRLTGSEPAAAGQAVNFDALVGQINGRPVFASAFLDPLEGRLLAARKQFPDRQAWMREAAKAINDALTDKVRDDLLLAEALASLTPEMKEMGIRYFLGQLRSDLARQNSGSAETANARLVENEGLTIDQKARLELNKELGRTELRKHIMPKVNVSSREVRDFYRQNYDRYNPPGQAKLRLIRVRNADADGLQQVTDLLSTGVPFEEAAKLPANTFKREEGGLLTVEVDPEYQNTKFVGIAALNERAVQLKPGETDGPIVIDDATFWMQLERIQTPPAVSIYDAQLDINTAIRERKFNEAMKRYFDRLLKRGSYSDIRLMTERLLRIATERYYGSGA